MRYFPLILACCIFLITSCNNDNGKKQDVVENKAQAQPVRSTLDAAGTQKMVALITDYYSLKDALVATKAARADSAATSLNISTNNMAASLQNDAANKQTLQPYLDTILTENKKILALKDETCEQKRIPFGKISDVMFQLIKKVDLKNAGVYREYCPMAFNEKGAYWLSNDPEIKNPYFGKKMLECGEVTDTLK